MAEFTSYAHGTPGWVDVTSAELDRSIAFDKGRCEWEAEQVQQPDTGAYTMFMKDGSTSVARR